MQDILNFLIENPYVTVLIGVVVFILTLIFVVKRIFSFVATLILLIICIIAAYVVIYPESTTNFLKGYTENGPDNTPDDGSSKTVKEYFEEAIDVGKDKYQEYKEKLFPDED